MRQARMVRIMRSPPEALGQEAERITEEAIRRATANRPTGKAPEPTAASSVGAPTGVPAEPHPAPPAEEPETACSPADPKYDECVIRAYEGKARTARELALLIETYRSVRNTVKSLEHMEEFVRRFPGHPRASQYRQILTRYGR